ncbi:GNAT family N-acetyltransferase [Ornithinibacillus salinisoli]|uniref:GNAT family N-acetyltransferase n=1 Tax=Ornithinibacillus salinisoli TaxID=1848459 RepID=A0ABW4VYK8_9BACI
MRILDKSEYQLILPVLIENARTCPTFAYSVAESIIPGVVFVDDLNQPSTVLIGTNNGIYFIAGNGENTKLNHMFFDFYKQQTAGSGQRFTLFSATRSWDHIIRNLLKEEALQMNRYLYKFNPRKYMEGKKKQLPVGFTIEEISKDTIERSTNFNNTYYDEYWDGVTNFLKHSFGFCVLYQGRVVSECTAIFMGQSIVGIDIFTQHEFTGNGLAYILGKAFIDKCLKQGLTPSWDCDVKNVSSLNLANKLGFENHVEYSIFVRKKELA